MERRPPELLDRLAIRAAHLRHSDRKSVREVRVELQAAGEPVRQDDDIRMLLRRALTSGLVKVEVTRTPSTGTLDLDVRLGRRLAERFGMRNIYVVTDRALAGLKYQDPLAYGDQIFLGLGWAAAGFLINRIRDSDTIAVGGGQAESIVYTRPRLVRPATATTLTSRMSSSWGSVDSGGQGAGAGGVPGGWGRPGAALLVIHAILLLARPTEHGLLYYVYTQPPG